MFSFYGSKSKIVRHYSKPLHDEIVESHAGSARYAYEYHDRNITIVDIDPVIIAVWRYLQQASPHDIRRLPDVPNATKLSEIEGFTQLAQEEKWLIGFCSNGGSAQPKNVSGRHNFNSWNKDKERIALNLWKIRHWRIVLGDYKDIPNRIATWFIDPPYQEQGKWYKHNNIDYYHLAEWCKSRLGQIIVCENAGADWLPFVPFRDIPFTHFKTKDDLKKRTKEVIWYRENNE